MVTQAILPAGALQGAAVSSPPLGDLEIAPPCEDADRIVCVTADSA